MDSNTRLRSGRRTHFQHWFLGLALTLCGNVYAQNTSFNVTVNTGPVAPNSDTIYPGEATSLRISLSNNSTLNPITGVNFSKPLPMTATAGLLVNGLSSIGGDAGCTGGTLSTTDGQPGVAPAGLTLAGLTVPVRIDGVPGSGECYLDIPTTAFSVDGASTSLSYALNAGEVDSNQGVNATGGPQAITLRSVQRPQWSKALLGGDVVILGGDTKTLRINLENPDRNISLSNISFTDVLPVRGSDGALIEPTGTPATGSCVGGAVGAVVNLQGGAAAQIAVSGATLLPQSSCTIDVEVQARHTDSRYERSQNNTIYATSFSSDEGLQPAANAVTRVRARSPLGVRKSFNPGIIASGVRSSVRITLTNASSNALPVARFTDNPIGVSGSGFVGLSIAGAADVVNSCGGTVGLLDTDRGFEITGFNLPAAGNCVIDVMFTGLTPSSDEPTTYTNRIAPGAVEISGQPGIISQTRTATVIVADRLRVQKSRSPAVTAPGNPVRYELTVQNYSDSPIAGVTVADSLQNGSTLLTGADFTPSLTAGCGVLDLNGRVEGDSDLLFTIPTIPGRSAISSPGACTVTFWAMIDPASTGATTNQVSAGDVCIGGNPASCNQGASQEVSTGFQQVLTFNKTFDAQENVSLSEGQTSRLRLRLDNYSVNSLSTITISDTFPSAGPFQQLRIASPPAVSNTCGGTVVAVAGQTSLELNSGSVAPFSGTVPGSCQIELDVVGPAGVYPNTADVAALQTLADGSTNPVSASDGATLTYTDTLAITKRFSPDEVGPGGRSTVHIGFTSLDPLRPITGISVLDNLPVGMLIADPDNAYTTCNGNTMLEASPAGSSASLQGASLAPGASCELLFDVIVSGNADWVNTIPPGQITADGGLTNRDPVTATLTYSAPPVPLISKSISPGVIVPGESAVLTVNITNGADPLTNLQLTDYFTLDGTPTGAANGMQVSPSPEFWTDCPGGIVSAPPDGSSVMLSGVNINSNQACQVRVKVTSTTVGTITNTIPVNSISTDEGATNTTTFAQSTLSTTDTLGVSKLFVPAVVSANEPARLRITFYNAQPGSLTNFAITDNFPAGLVSAPEPAPFSNCGGGVAITYPDSGSVALSGGSLGPAVNDEAASCYLETSVISATEGTYTNTIAANSMTVNGTPATHPQTSAKLEVRKRLVVNKAIDNLTLDADAPAGFTTGTAARLPGVPAPLTIRLENPNDIALTQVSFVDALPSGLVVATTPNLGTTCVDGVVTGNSSARQVVLAGASLAARGDTGSVCTVTVDVVSNIPGVYVNEIPEGGVSSFEGITNLQPTQARLIISRPGTVAKDFAPPVIAPGATAQLSIIIGNDNDLDMTLSAPLVDNLPASPAPMLVATPNGLATDCPGGNAIVSAAAGSPRVEIASGSVIPPGGCVVTVNVTATDAGVYINNIPVGGLQTDFGPSEVAATAPLNVSTLGYISGKVFLDNQADPDGSYIAGASTPISGNTVELHRSADCDDGSPLTTQTDAQGNYLFSDLSAGTYSVCQPVQPGGTLNSVTTPGVIVPYNGSTGTEGGASNPATGTPSSKIAAIVLNDSGSADEVSGSPQNNFSEVLPASLAGRVFYDRNNDGVIDPGESGIADVVVELSGPVSRSVLTAADGSYSFTDLPPGNYTLTEVQPSGWSDGIDSLGSNSGDAGVDDVLGNVALAPGDTATQYNFGEYLLQDSLILEATGVCENDVPFVDYSVSSLEGFSGGAAPLVTVTWLTEGGRVAQALESQTVSGRLLWPGAAVDGSGVGVAWPGWEFVDEQWVAVEDDRLPTMMLRVTVNPTAEAIVSYPAATPVCQAQPPGTARLSSQAIPATPSWALVILSLLMALAATAGLNGRRKLA